jgi:transcriptional regulator with XRE-family HTH domain
MAARPTGDPETEPNLLPQILKAIRRRRGLSVKAAAAAMPMALRSYVHFESGRGRLKIERIYQFAQMTNSDPLAILIALEIKSPAFALRCMENKGMTIFVMALKQFDAQVKDDFTRLDPRTLVSASRQFFDGLSAKIQELDAYLEQWMSDRALSDPLDPEDED